MNILIISPDYPDKFHNGAAFVQQLVNEFARMGNHCCVIAPHSLSRTKRLSQGKESFAIGAGSVMIERPSHISFSTLRIFGRNISSILRQRAINKALNRMIFVPDVVYCHFWRCGYEGFHYAKKKGIPLFVASGESSIPAIEHNDREDFFRYVKGVVCVSSKNKKESIEKGMTTADKCVVFPNAINQNLFKKMDKNECRAKLGLPKEAFITATLGWFSQRKGQQRVAQAISMLNDDSIKSVFIGGGEDSPTGSHIVFCGQVMHDNVPMYLNSADVYVLPTRAEGCCNSIIEAMACGQPIISSDRSFNYDICNKSNSILIDPDNIDEIASAIKRVKEDTDMQVRMSEGAIATAKNLSIEKRAKGVLDFMISRMGN